jgi:hypothetical protein
MKSWITGLAALLIAGASQSLAETGGTGRYGTINMIRGVERSLIVFDFHTGNSWITRIDGARAQSAWRFNNRVFGTNVKRLLEAVRTGAAAIKLLALNPDILRGGEFSHAGFVLHIRTTHH